MTLRLYNTLTNREEDFTPLDPDGKQVLFYSCGPTVYDYAHIGNFRSFLNADVMRRTLELLGYEVRHVMNMTDVGHMSDDDLADGGGQDKMELAAARLAEAKKAGKLPLFAMDDPTDPFSIAEFYIHEFLDDARTLGMKIAFEQQERPELMPRPTQFITPMIGMIQSLIDREHAYVASDGVVYFDVQSFPDYGRLSGNTPDRIRSGEGGRVNEATQSIKRHPADFMLWKPDPKHLMRWESPWGEGYPGWHLECSVMAASLLAGDTNGVIDLHSGGEDNIFPHHECEIAQSCGVSGESHFARYWFHTRFLIVEGEKMSKSKGNFFTLSDEMAKGATPAAIRLELIKTHYRSQANYTTQGLRDSQRQIERWKRLESWLETHAAHRMDGPGPLRQALKAFIAALSSDLNVAGAIGVLSEAAGHYDVSRNPSERSGDSSTLADELDALHAMNSVLGVLDIQTEQSLHGSATLTLPPLEVEASGTVQDARARIEQLISQRDEARARKDWGAADEIRDKLLALGIAIKDGKEGTTWTKVIG